MLETKNISIDEKNFRDLMFLLSDVIMANFLSVEFILS